MLARMARELGLTIDGDPLADPPVNDSYARALLPVVRAANLLTGREAPGKRTLLHLPYWYTVRKFLFAKANKLKAPRYAVRLGQQLKLQGCGG